MTKVSSFSKEKPGKYIPDILDVIAALSSDAIPTPPVLAQALLDLLPDQVWTNPKLRWLNPASKSGSILREIVRRLMDGLEYWEPDAEKRAEHILRNMVFGCAVTQVHGEMSRRSVYVSRDASSEHAVVRFANSDGNIPFLEGDHDYVLNRNGEIVGPCRICSAPVTLDRGPNRENHAYAFIHEAYPPKGFEEMKFDVIVGNPPYQIRTGTTSAQATPIYQEFVKNAISLAPKYVAMITPSRWFTGGMGLDAFRDQMVNDRHLRAIVDNPKLFDCFPGVEIKGGVSYFLWDRDYDGDCQFSTRVDGEILSTTTRDLRLGDGVVIRDNNAVSIIAKVVGTKSIEQRVSPVGPFGASIATNFKGATAEPSATSVPLIFGSHVANIERTLIEKNHSWIDKWKVLIPRAGDGHGREISYVIGEPIALAPGSICTFTYLVAGVFESKAEALNYTKYLTSKFARFLVLQRKSTQDIRPDRFKFVPDLDFTREWTDEDLYAKYELDASEILYIENSIHPRDFTDSLNAAIPATHLPGGSKYKDPDQRAETEGDDITEDDE